MRKAITILFCISCILLSAANVSQPTKAEEFIKILGSSTGTSINKTYLSFWNPSQASVFYYSNYFSPEYRVGLHDLSIYEDEDGNLSFFYESTTREGREQRRYDLEKNTIYVVGAPTYVKNVIFPVTKAEKKTDNWISDTKEKSLKKKNRALETTKLPEQREYDAVYEGFSVKKGFYYYLRKYTPKDNQETVEMLVIKGGTVYDLLPLMNTAAKQVIAASLDLSKPTNDKYWAELSALNAKLNSIPQKDEFETTAQYEARLKKAQDEYYKGELELSQSLPVWKNEDSEKVNQSRQEVILSPDSVGSYNADSLTLQITVKGINGYILIPVEDARSMKENISQISVKANQIMKANMTGYDYQDIIIFHPITKAEYLFRQN